KKILPGLQRWLGKHLGDRFAVTTGTPAVKRLDRKNGERGPNESKRNQMGAGERLVVEKNTEKKTAGRREILEETNCRQAEVPRGMSEPDEGQSCHDAGADQQQCKRPIHWTEDQSASTLEIQYEQNSDRREERRLEKKAGDGSRSGFLAEQA